MSHSRPESGQDLNAPDKCPLAFRVGITGHRFDRLSPDLHTQSQLRHMIGVALGAVKATLTGFPAGDNPTASNRLYSDAQPSLTAVSALAEGADQLFAEAAVAQGFALSCVLPFSIDEYEKDFKDVTTRGRFRDLLAAARRDGAIYEIDADHGQGDDLGPVYAAAGNIVVNQCDLLIAIWDGDRVRDKDGGTFSVMTRALEYNVPVLWIAPAAPFAWQILFEKSELDDQPVPLTPAWTASPTQAQEDDKLGRAVEMRVLDEISLMEPPADLGDQGGDQRSHHHAARSNLEAAKTYFEEKRRRFNKHVLWKLFRNLMAGDKIGMPGLFVGPYGAMAGTGPHGQPANGAVADADAQMMRHYAFADRQADIYADAHRSSVLYTSFLAAMAVIFAVAPFSCGDWLAQAFGGAERASQILFGVCAIAELILLTSLASILKHAQARRWHDRWLEYRILAEWIRQLRLLAPVGGGFPMPHAPQHLAVYGRPNQTWMYWHMRAIGRSLRLPTVKADSAFKLSYLQALGTVTSEDDPRGQGYFHNRNKLRCGRIDANLRKLAENIVRLTVICVTIHILFLIGEAAMPAEYAAAGHWFAHLSKLTLLMTAGGPAVVAALANINNQGEYARIAKRSDSMAKGMRRFHSQTERLIADVNSGRPLSLTKISDFARQITASMVQEAAEWHALVFDQPHANV